MEGGSIAVIVVALIGAIGTILSNIIIGRGQSKDIDAKLSENQAVMKERIDNLTKEVNKHNNFAEQIPDIKKDVQYIGERVTKLETRVDDLRMNNK